MGKKLYRSRGNRMIAGICGGLGEYLDADPTVIRIVFIILALLGLFPGVLLYLALWLVIPDAPRDENHA